ncbi:MAG TPA: DNA polymerase IV [Jatrophihabitans sp.]|nr:DNA polymerase IV [Jatrophihabitans sp.]
MRSDAAILHADLDAFYASVEQRDRPALRGRPVIVGGGVVLAASYEAKAFGVRTAMPGGQARRLCPQAVVVPPRMAAYTQASRDVFGIFADTTPLVEGTSIDEAFLDVAGLRRVAGSPLQIAVRLRARVLAEAGLPITVGVARTRFLAKVASGVAKPDGLLLVPPGSEQEFLLPLPVERLWGVGSVTAAKLHRHGLTTVADVAALPEPSLVAMLGAGSGRQLFALAHGLDPRPVRPGRRRRSMGAQRALGRQRRSGAELDAYLGALIDRVSRRLRAAGRTCRTVVLRFRFDDFTRTTRAHTLPSPTDNTATILAAARILLAAQAGLIAERGLTLIGVTLASLDHADSLQLELPFENAPSRQLDRAVDDIRQRFGTAALGRAAMIGRDPGVAVPLLPD